MTTFITGGSGFVGRELVSALAGREIVALARSDAAAAVVQRLGARPARGDLGDLDALVQAMRGSDLVIHAAASTAEWGPRAEFEAANVTGTARVIEAARRVGARRLVHISTEAVLLGSGPIVRATEDRALPRRALGAYADTKNRAERLVRDANGPELASVVVRPRLVWGRGDTSLLPKLLDAVRQGRWRWIGGGRYPTSTCHVRNLAEGVLLAAERGQPGGVYFLSDGPPVELRGFVSALIAAHGLPVPTRSVPRVVAKIAATLVEGWWRLWRLRSVPPVHRTPVWLMGEEVTVDDGRARRELGYVGRVDRATGLAELGAERQDA